MSTEPTTAPPSPTFRGPGDAFLVLGALVLSLVGIVYQIVHTPELLDTFVRNQRLILPIAGVLLALVSLFLASVARIPDRDATGKLVWPGKPVTLGRIIRQPRVLLTPILLPFSVVSVIGFLLGLSGAAAQLVPKSAGLELPPMLRNDPNNRELLLFIHGWNGDAAGTWKQFPTLASTDPDLRRYNIWVLDYPTYMLKRNLQISEVGDFFHRHLNDTAKVFDRYDRVVVIAHSMGGLVAREISIQHNLTTRRRAFDRIIEIATPHEGGNVAGLASALGLSRGFTNNMEHGSSYLKGLSTYWYALGDKPFTFCIGSPHDRVVSADSATRQCSDATHYLGGGHTAIVKPNSRDEYYYATPIAKLK